ncbi:hypothetical protein PF002_g22528 [Phytophthora fragariae]|uniref:Uncharacterized protein n=1 Tax=Phytophthora fragariae TaxID=53985 RepID=A0A6A3X7Z8_9STRA|nr:hypothetical protein PF003_g2194 [Phytophthora fragariae]KAE8983043.1 hypothetical protein PF011_g21362 [Phytophthora fragariae]KAE9191806.1 hypothetical protein PF004_g21501 [Phytophthora fragariae]KAE9198146.1 hypothetical protein PF002_g22528 [Phytophthora fragariae]
MRYLSDTKDYYLKLAATQSTRLVVTTDADWVNDKSNRKSVSGHIVYLFGCPVHWSSSQQGIVAMSSTAAEFIAASEGQTQSEWIKLMVDSILKVDESVPPPLCLRMDSKSVIRRQARRQLGYAKCSGREVPRGEGRFQVGPLDIELPAQFDHASGHPD